MLPHNLTFNDGKAMVSFLIRFSFPLYLMVTFSAVSQADTLEGFTEPYRQVDVSVGEPGVIEKIHVKPGDEVKAGDVVLSLNTDVLEATLKMAKRKAASSGALEAADAELSLRRARVEQIRLLRKRGHATQRELARAEADLNIARARTKLAREEVELNQLDCQRIEAQIARRRVRSPFAGIVAEVHREEGEAYLVTDPRMVTVVQLDMLRSRLSATPQQAAKLHVNQTVSLKLPDLDKTVEARVDRISAIVDAKSGTIEIHVVIDNAQQTIKSGTRCLLEVEAGARTDSYAGVRRTDRLAN